LPQPIIIENKPWQDSLPNHFAHFIGNYTSKNILMYEELPSISYPMNVGRNFAEILRALDAIQITEGVPLATPANWEPGQDVIVGLALNDEQAKVKYGELDIKLPYLRYGKLPK
jgi:hypothetical protein